jgi:hypothetical protein
MLKRPTSIRRQTCAWLVLLAFAGTPAGANAKDRLGLVYIEFRFLSPMIKSGSFEASIRKLWRSGDRYLRVEEAPDPQQRIHGVIIVNEPNAWMWNRFDNTARHSVDPGPSYIARFALFSGERSKALQELEFGREKDFFATNNAIPMPDQNIDGIDCTLSPAIERHRLPIHPAEFPSRC